MRSRRAGQLDDRRIVWIYRRMPCMHDAIGANALSERSDRVDRPRGLATISPRSVSLPVGSYFAPLLSFVCFPRNLPSTSAGRGVVDSVS